MENLVVLLLVEDEEMIRLALSEALTDAGFGVVEAVNGEEAIQRLDAGDGVTGVITDIRLPGSLNGWQIGRHARHASPGIPIVYMSGDSAADWSSEGVPNSVMVQKPFAMVQVVTAISTLLNGIDPTAG